MMGFLGFNFNTLDQVCRCSRGPRALKHIDKTYRTRLEHRRCSQLGFYGSYHSKKGNQLIHFFFVPLIVWSVLVWLAYAGPVPHTDLPAHLRSLPEPVARSAQLTSHRSPNKQLGNKRLKPGLAQGRRVQLGCCWRLHIHSLLHFAGAVWWTVLGRSSRAAAVAQRNIHISAC